jgi:diacylglycerol kinase (ATP)
VSIKKRIQSFGFAFKGIATLFRTQPNARIHLLAMSAVTVAGYLLKVSTSEWCFIVLAFTMVLAAEAFNTAVEFVVDLASPDYHHLAGMAKDVAAAAVLITAIGAASIGIIVFLPKLLMLLREY